MKIIVENKIPFIDLRLNMLGTVVRLSPEDITPETVADADVLVVRTRTRCGAALLDGSQVKTVCTATIGTDHIDLEYCRANGIRVVNAPGCNAPAVAQWVYAAINSLSPAGFYTTPALGIIGVGHVGSIVAEWGRALGFDVLLNDPPRAACEPGFQNIPVEKLVERADIITVHTPLDASTRHLLGHELLGDVKRGAYLLNAARGPVTDTHAVVDALRGGRLGGAAIDCWENEPDISLDLMKLSVVATPHIAGYSVEGKRRAADAVVSALAGGTMTLPQSRGVPASVAEIAASYDIMTDTERFKVAPAEMERLRNTYPLRHEYGFA